MKITEKIDLRFPKTLVDALRLQATTPAVEPEEKT